jgi:phosphatidylserine/phosphatidylglycerophosphate/cardiolipin synthase-like enzyme
VETGGFPGNAGSVHSKMLIADGEATYVGSGEITASGLATNFEAGAIFTGLDLVRFFEDAFELIWKRADPITRPWLQKHIFSLRDVSSI